MPSHEEITALKGNSLDERIAQLESKLARSESDSSSDGGEGGVGDSDSNSDSSDDVGDDEVRRGGLLSCSKLGKEDAIPKLPSHMLPDENCGGAGKKRKKRGTACGGIKTKVAKVDIDAKVPYCCRPCGFVGTCLEDYLKHREEAACKRIRRAMENRWKCCGKTFNGEKQLTEHRKSGKCRSRNGRWSGGGTRWSPSSSAPRARSFHEKGGKERMKKTKAAPF